MLVQTRDLAVDRQLTEEKHAALGYISDAFAEASLDGIDVDCMAQAALFFALKEMVESYGEAPVATFTEALSARILNGEFTLKLQTQ